MLNLTYHHQTLELPYDSASPPALFQTMFGRMPDGVVLLDPLSAAHRWPIVDCNEVFAQLVGRSRAALAGCPIDALVWRAEALACDPGYLARLQRQGSHRYEFEIAQESNQMRVLEMTMTPVQLAQHQYVLGICRDISHHREGEQELQRRAMLARGAVAVAVRLSALQPSEVDRAVNESLATIGACLEVEHVYAGILSHDGEAFVRSYSWVEPSVAHCTTQRDAEDWFEQWTQPSGVGRSVFSNLLHDSSSIERAYVGNDALRTSVAVPLRGAGDLVGVIGCTSTRLDRCWSDAEIRLLATAGDCILRSVQHAGSIAALQNTDTRYQLLTNHATDVISLHDAEGIIRYCSPSVRAILGYQPEELIGLTPFDLLHPEDLMSAIAKGKVHDTGALTTTYRIRHRDGYYIWAETSARVVCDADSGHVHEIVAITRDVDARKRFDAQIEQLAYYDPLTMLANRRRFHEHTEQALERAERQTRRTALLYLDLDGFKKVNDTLGHDAGDELLVQVARRLSQQLRENETLARLGGDEFAVLIPACGTEHEIASVAERLVEHIRMPFTIRGQTIHLGVSIGIACAPQDGRFVEDLLKHADIAMYRAKVEGDRFQFFDPALSEYSQERLQTESELRQAITTRQLFMEYQPIIDLRSERIASVESLVRWQHPVRGRVMPDQFIPLAEECGLIRELDRAVLLDVMQQIKTWSENGQSVAVAVNLSARTLHDTTFPEFARACLRETGVPAQRIILEMTESAAMRDIDRTCGVLQELRDLGMRVALDDFGSGHTSLKHLKLLPIDYVKIDRSFIEGIGRDSRDEGVVRAIVALSEGLGVPVVAEGVANDAQVAWLRAIGCTMVQGYAIGMPLAAHVIGQFASQSWQARIQVDRLERR